jgi:hypothetical protein
MFVGDINMLSGPSRLGQSWIWDWSGWQRPTATVKDIPILLSEREPQISNLQLSGLGPKMEFHTKTYWLTDWLTIAHTTTLSALDRCWKQTIVGLRLRESAEGGLLRWSASASALKFRTLHSEETQPPSSNNGVWQTHRYTNRKEIS